MRLFVIQTPDWNGGHDFRIEFTEEPFLGDFEYEVADYKLSKIEEHLDDTFVGHKEPLYEEQYDYNITLRELLES